MAEKRKGLLERLKTRKTLILREPLSARLERKVHGSTRGETEKTYYVRYIDLATGKTMEKTIADIEQYDLYKQQREGEISIIEIHRVKDSPVETEGSSNPKFWAVMHDGFSERFYTRENAINHAKKLEEKWGKAVQVKVAEYTPDPTEPTGYKIQVIYPESKLLLYSAQEENNPTPSSRVEVIRQAEKANVWEVNGTYTVDLYGSWSGAKTYPHLKSVSFPALTKWEKRDGFSTATFPRPTTIEVDMENKSMSSSSSSSSAKHEKSTSELAEAKRQLKIYSERVGCSWCQRKASEIAGLIEKLENLTPLASQFAEQVGSLEAENIQRLNEEIRQVTNQNCPTCKIKR